MVMIRQSTLQFNTSSAGSILLRRLCSAAETNSKAEATDSPPAAATNLKTAAKLSPRDLSSKVRQVREKLLALRSGDGRVGELPETTVRRRRQFEQDRAGNEFQSIGLPDRAVSPPAAATRSNAEATFSPPATATSVTTAGTVSPPPAANSVKTGTVSPPAAATRSNAEATFSPPAAATSVKTAVKVSPPAAATSVKTAVKVSPPPAANSVKAAAKLSRDFSPEVRRLSGKLMALSSGDGRIGELLSRYRIGKSGYIRCAEELRKNKRHQLCLKILEWMEKHGFKRCSRTHVLAIDAIYNTKGIEEAEKYFESFSENERNQYTYGALLHCYCCEKMAEKANKLFEKMLKIENLSDLTLLYMMNSALTAGDSEKVISLAVEMKRRNLPSDAGHPAAEIILIQSFKMTNDAEGYERFIDESEKDGKSCHWSTYSDLAELCIKAGDFDRAEKALKRIEQVKSSNPDPLNYLIRIYAGMRDLDGVNRVWSILKSRVQYPSNLSYVAMLQSLLKLNEMDQFLNCYEEWKSGYKLFDLRIATVAIDCYLRQGRIEEADKVFNEACRKSGRTFFSGHEVLMAHFLRKRQARLALRHLRAAVGGAKSGGRLQWRPPGWVVSGFWRCLEEERDVVGAEEFRELLKEVDCFDMNSHVSFLGACLGAAKNVPKEAGEGGDVARGGSSWSWDLFGLWRRRSEDAREDGTRRD